MMQPALPKKYERTEVVFSADMQPIALAMITLARMKPFKRAEVIE